MKNEKGITLIELLGVLVILSILLTLAGSILTSSLKTSNRATTDQRMQQEANYITEKVRNEYLKKPSDAGPSFELKIKDDQLLLDDKMISEGYHYSFCLDETPCEEIPITIDRSKPQQPFQLILTAKDNGRTHEIDTKLSKLK